MRNRRRKVGWLGATTLSLGLHILVLLLLLAPEPASVNTPADPDVVEIQLIARLDKIERKLNDAGRANSTPGPMHAQAAKAISGPDATELGQSAIISGTEKLLGPMIGSRSKPPIPTDGCDLGLLSAAERRDCERRQLAAARQRGRTLQNDADADQEGQFGLRDPLPYLARNPTNGCKLKTGGGSGLGQKDPPAAGIACAFSF